MKSVWTPLIKQNELKQALELQYGQDFMQDIENTYADSAVEPFKALIYDLGYESETSNAAFVQIPLQILLGYDYKLQNTVINFLIDTFSNCRFVMVEL